MTVAELILELQKLPRSYEVFVWNKGMMWITDRDTITIRTDIEENFVFIGLTEGEKIQ